MTFVLSDRNRIECLKSEAGHSDSYALQDTEESYFRVK